MRSEFDGLEAAGTLVEVSELPADTNAGESKWLLQWKGDARGIIDISKARLVANGYSQIEDTTSKLLPPLPRSRLADLLQQ